MPEQEELEGATYGNWKDFWEKFLEEKRKKIEKDEEERKDRIERTKRGEKSWELVSTCRDIIEELKSTSWIRNKQMRKE